MLTFWDTVRGVNLADTLIHQLPKLTAKKEQKIVLLSNDANDATILEKEMENGFLVVACNNNMAVLERKVR
ncbi:MAG: hypothetical protein K6G11_07135 [Lachnospiraceae bacterium]|nr:hypothetical protein [Lachnospiraceae bacterium]